MISHSVFHQERRMDVTAWLRRLGLEQYEDTFRRNGVDSSVLTRLTPEDLRDLGVAAVGDRRKLTDAIAALSQAEAAPPRKGSAIDLAPGERRQVTVMFADLCGFTKLSREIDAEELHALLGLYFEAVDGIVDAHGGYVDKHVGDSVMAVFGAPVAHG